MAFTRHAHRLQQIENSRLLRSGRTTATHTGRASPSYRILKSRHPATPILSPANGGESLPYFQQLGMLRGVPCGDCQRQIHDAGPLCEEGGGGHLPSVAGNNDFRDFAVPEFEADSSMTRLRVSSPTLVQSTADADAGNLISKSQGEDEAAIAEPTSRPKDSPASLEDAGIPPDGLWDHDAAYNQRYCFDHGETEYLLGTADRWMSPGDFRIPDARTALETLLQRHEGNPAEFDPYRRRCHAECWGNLYDHVHSVINRREQDGGSWYLVRWKACWTPESNIDDRTWIAASLKANRNPKCRHSARTEYGFAERKKKYDQIMVVVNLE